MKQKKKKIVPFTIKMIFLFSLVLLISEFASAIIYNIVNVSKYQKENEITTTTTTEGAHAQGDEIEESPVKVWEVKRYFEDNFPQFTKGLLKDTYDALSEANKFVAYNAKRGWDCLPNWKATADLWVARAGEKGGKG